MKDGKENTHTHLKSVKTFEHGVKSYGSSVVLWRDWGPGAPASWSSPSLPHSTTTLDGVYFHHPGCRSDLWSLPLPSLPWVPSFCVSSDRVKSGNKVFCEYARHHPKHLTNMTSFTLYSNLTCMYCYSSHFTDKASWDQSLNNLPSITQRK